MLVGEIAIAAAAAEAIAGAKVTRAPAVTEFRGIASVLVGRRRRSAGEMSAPSSASTVEDGEDGDEADEEESTAAVVLAAENAPAGDAASFPSIFGVAEGVTEIIESATTAIATRRPTMISL